MNDVIHTKASIDADVKGDLKLLQITDTHLFAIAKKIY